VEVDAVKVLRAEQPFEALDEEKIGTRPSRFVERPAPDRDAFERARYARTLASSPSRPESSPRARPSSSCTAAR
jgi:hypothetical protein